MPVLIVSGIAALLMLAGALLLGGDVDDDGEDSDEGAELSVRAVLLDTADAATAAGVAATGAVIFQRRLYWLDPTVALVIAVVIGLHAIRLLRRIQCPLRSMPSRSAAA